MAEKFNFAAMQVLKIAIVDNCYNCDCGDGCDGGDGGPCDCVSCDSCNCDSG
jgi:hypothetical protein